MALFKRRSTPDDVEVPDDHVELAGGIDAPVVSAIGAVTIGQLARARTDCAGVRPTRSANAASARLTHTASRSRRRSAASVARSAPAA